MRGLPQSTAIAPCSFEIGFARGLRFAERMISRGHVRLIGNIEFGGRAPEAFKVIVSSGMFAEDMQDEAPKIDESPFRGRAPFAVFRRTLEMLFELVFHFAADGLHLRRAEPRTDYEIVRESSDATEVENGYSGSFFISRRLNSQADALWQRVQFHRYKPCFRMYSSTRTETSP